MTPIRIEYLTSRAVKLGGLSHENRRRYKYSIIRNRDKSPPGSAFIALYIVMASRQISRAEVEKVYV